jgi:hypothetical protein
VILKNQKFLFGLLLIALFLAFWIHGNSGLDPDFGWHLKMGQLISQSGIPKTDPFSYTMSSFPFVDHEWLTNLLISKLYPILGLSGLSAIFSLLTLITLLIIFPRKLGEWVSVPFVLAAGIFISFAGVRTQIITWFFLALLLRIITDESLWKKFKWFIPAMFLLWANLHAGFAAGIVALLVVTSVQAFVILSKTKDLYIRKRFFSAFRMTAINWLIFLASLGATFINPYSWRLWGEVGMQISDSGLHISIGEWLPAIYYPDLSFLMLLAFTVLFILYRLYHKNFQPRIQIVLYAGLFLAAISAVRNIPLWTIVAAPLLALFFKEFFQSLEKDKYGSETFKKCYSGLTYLVTIIFLVTLFTSIYKYQKISEDNFYPKQAIKFLKDQKITGQVFSEYDWGGYLIWQYPEKKVFVDGRMPSWRRDQAPVSESIWAFRDYLNMVYENGDFNKEFMKYNITTVLWPAPVPQKTDFFSQIKTKYYQIIDSYFPTSQPTSLTKRLKASGWHEIYHDKVAVIYQKN